VTITDDPQAKRLDPRQSRFLVIGATGLLGRQLVRELSGRQWPVRALRRWDASATGLDFPGVDIVVGDLFEPASLAEAIAGVNGVFYCSAPDPGAAAREILRTSVEAFRRALAACRDHDVERLVLTSSASTVARGAPGTRATEDQYYLPGTSDDPFVEAKYAVEQEAYRAVADGFDVVILNPTLMVGPGVDLTPYSRLGLRGSEPMNIVDVREVARLHAQAFLSGRRGARYILGQTNTTAAQVFDGWPSRGKNAVRPREAYLVEQGQWYDLSRARRELSGEVTRSAAREGPS
jgi:dihydroflavonol-4-reductase